MTIAFTFVHAADLHLDSPFRGAAGAPPAVRERLRESTFAALRRLVDAAKRERADFVVLAGDLYDAEDRSLRAQLRFQQAAEELADSGIAVYIAHGNHDSLGGAQAKLAWPDAAYVFGPDEPSCFPAYRRDGRLAAYVYGVSYGTAAERGNLAAKFRPRPDGPFHLAVLHANVDGDPAHDNYAPCRLGELTAAGFDYWALGHVHQRRVLHEYPHVVYPGNAQGRSAKETGPRGAYVVRVSDTGQIRLDFRDLADVLWRETAVSVSGLEREQELKARLLETAESVRLEAQGRPVMLRIRLEGRGPLHERLQREGAADAWLAELRDWLGEPEADGGWVWPERVTVRTAPAEDWRRSASAGGFLGELAAQAARAAADPAEARRTLRDALGELALQPRVRQWLDGLTDADVRELTERAADLAAALLQSGGDA
jgi:DNA repair exonuclease SbcCD nuclease subunit